MRGPQDQFQVNLSKNLASRIGNKTNMASVLYSFNICEGKLTAKALPYFFKAISLYSIVYRSMTHVILKKICMNLNMLIELKLSSRYALYPVVLVCAVFVSLTFLYLSLLF